MMEQRVNWSLEITSVFLLIRIHLISYLQVDLRWGLSSEKTPNLGDVKKDRCFDLTIFDMQFFET